MLQKGRGDGSVASIRQPQVAPAKIKKNPGEKLVNGYGVSLAETARQLGVSTSGISQMLRRGSLYVLSTTSPKPSEIFASLLRKRSGALSFGQYHPLKGSGKWGEHCILK